MAVPLEPGGTIRSYRITKKLNVGGMAEAYHAKNAKGENVFLKQYHSPSKLLRWYGPYMAYQEAMKVRIEASPFRNFTYRLIEYFEEEVARVPCYIQVIEFVDAGQSLENRLERAEDRRTPLTWHQRLTMAKVMMGAIKALHKTKIVHSDLKPANIILIDSTSKMGYSLKVIDLDFSILADQKAPWHDVDDQGYFGTPTYQSPEHINGTVPSYASDMFTCGIILYELLAKEQHPYPFGDPDEYAPAIKAGSAPPPTLLDEMPAGNDEEIIKVLHRCLSPNAADRPTAEALHAELCSTGSSSSPTRSPARRAPPTPTPSTSTPPPAPPKPAKQERLVLRGSSGEETSFGVSAVVGGPLLAQFGDESQFLSDPQFHLEKEGTTWFVTPDTNATNQTMLNSKQVKERVALKKGDVLGVGNEAKKIVKLPLQVDFE